MKSAGPSSCRRIQSSRTLRLTGPISPEGRRAASGRYVGTVTKATGVVPGCLSPIRRLTHRFATRTSMVLFPLVVASPRRLPRRAHQRAIDPHFGHVADAAEVNPQWRPWLPFRRRLEGRGPRRRAREVLDAGVLTVCERLRSGQWKRRDGRSPAGLEGDRPRVLEILRGQTVSQTCRSTLNGSSTTRHCASMSIVARLLVV